MKSPDSATHTCGNCGHMLCVHGCEQPHQCDLTGSKRIHPLMAGCFHWSHRPAARIHVVPKHTVHNRKETKP